MDIFIKRGMVIPDKFESLYRSITDETVFVFQKWYKYPTNELQIDFIEWYYHELMNIEFSENKTHFRVISFSAPPIDKWKGRGKFDHTHPLVQANSPERIKDQEEYWENFWLKKKGLPIPEKSDLITDDLSVL